MASDARVTAPLPVVVLIHGGFWRFAYTKVLMRRLASSVQAHGWAAWNIEYARVAPAAREGSWSRALRDVAAAVDHLAALPGLDLGRVATVGHSAGGQLALWVAGRRDGRVAGGATPPRVRPQVAVSLAGIVDLEEADRLGLGNDATAAFLGGHCADHPERYRQASPSARLPIGVPQVLVHGLDDRVVPPAMSETYCRTAQRLGDPARYVPLEGVGHRDLVDPGGPAWAATVSALEQVMA